MGCSGNPQSWAPSEDHPRDIQEGSSRDQSQGIVPQVWWEGLGPICLEGQGSGGSETLGAPPTRPPACPPACPSCPGHHMSVSFAFNPPGSRPRVGSARLAPLLLSAARDLFRFFQLTAAPLSQELAHPAAGPSSPTTPTTASPFPMGGGPVLTLSGSPRSLCLAQSWPPCPPHTSQSRHWCPHQPALSPAVCQLPTGPFCGTPHGPLPPRFLHAPSPGRREGWSMFGSQGMAGQQWVQPGTPGL